MKWIKEYLPEIILVLLANAVLLGTLELLK